MKIIHFSYVIHTCNQSCYVIWKLSISHMSYTLVTNPVMWYEKFPFLICHTHLHKKYRFIKIFNFIYILNDETKHIAFKKCSLILHFFGKKKQVFFTNPCMWYEKFLFLICHTHLKKKYRNRKFFLLIYILNVLTKQIAFKKFSFLLLFFGKKQMFPSRRVTGQMSVDKWLVK